MANYNNSNNWKAFSFLSVFIAELKINHINTFDVTKFIDVVMHLKNTPEFEGILNEFSTNFEQCQSQMIEMCGILNEGKYLEGETIYELHFINKNFDSNNVNLPSTIDKDLLNRFFRFMREIQNEIQQDVIPGSKLLEVILYLQKDKNFSDNDIKKQKEGIQKYLSILSRFGFLTMPSIYHVSISDVQLQIVLKNCQREEYKEIMKQVNLFLEYYKHPERLENIPVSSEQIQSTMERTSNMTEQKENIPLIKEATLRSQGIQGFSSGIESLKTPLVTEKNPSDIEPSPVITWPNLTWNEPVDYVPVSSRSVAAHSHFKSVRGVLLSFLSFLQTKGIDQFDSVSFEEAMNEMMKSSTYYEFPLNFPKFAEEYIGVSLKDKENNKNNNPYETLDDLAKKRRVKREGHFCFKLKFSKKDIDKYLNRLTDEDIQKMDHLAEQYLVSFHKMIR